MSPMWGAIAAIGAAVIALQIGLRELVFFFWREKDGELQDRVLPSIVLSAARFVVVLAGLGIAALVLEAPLASLAAAESPLIRLRAAPDRRRHPGAADACHLDHGAHRHRPAAEPRATAGHAPRSRSELAAAYAAAAAARHLRGAAAGDAGVTSLWALGLEITPVLAGAGVVGIALGFGAQALVRDVIAGIFYLAEDAFRIGEYIESGRTPRAWSSASRYAPWRCAITTARCTSCPTARSAPCATPRATG